MISEEVRKLLTKIPQPIRVIWQTLTQESQTFLVGGAVRDLLLGEIPHDYDFASARPPAEVIRWAHLQGWQAILTGAAFGTVTLRHPAYPNWPVELTTFRLDGAYKDSRHPDDVQFSNNIVDDLSRRDFTMNALAMSIDGQVVDPFEGQADLRNGVIKTVGDAAVRLREDPLRIWRAVRFVGKDHGGQPFTLAPETQNQIQQNGLWVLRISPERQRDELWKLLGTPHFDHALRTADMLGLLSLVWPEWAATRGFAQHNRHHAYPVHVHLLATAAHGSSEVLRLAGLLHDIGKPECLTLDASGQGHFYGHEVIGAVYAERMLRRLHFDGHTIQQVRNLVAHHMYPWESVGEKGLRRVAREWGQDHVEQLWELRKMDVVGSGTAENWMGESIVRERWQSAMVKAGEHGLKPAVGGREIMLWTHLQPGPEVGQWVRQIQDWIDENPSRNTPEQIKQFVEAHLGLS